jgi:hypothetical protein
MPTTHQPRPAPTRDDLFGPPPPPRADAPGLQASAHAPLREPLARLLVELAGSGWRGTSGTEARIDALRAEIDAVARLPRGRAPVARAIAAWLPKDAAPQEGGDAALTSELGLLVEGVASASAAERPRWARHLFLRFGGLVAEEMVRIAETADGLRPVLRGLLGEAELRAVMLGTLAAIPPARAAAFLALTLPAMDAAQRTAFVAQARAGAPDDTALAVVDGAVMLCPAREGAPALAA